MDKEECLGNATNEELLAELSRRRQFVLQHCLDEEIEGELQRRNARMRTVDFSDRPPKRVEK